MKKLQDFIKSTIDNRGKNPDRYFEDEKYPVIDNVLIKNTLYPDMSAVTRYIDQDTFDNFLRGYVHKNMPLITLVGNGIGNVTLAPSDEVAIVQNTIGFEVTAELDEVFLYYYLRNNQERIRGFNRGSGQPSIKKTDILSMEVDFPIIDIQKKIVNVLMRIDEKIENNNAINRNLQEQAFTLFDHMVAEHSSGDVCNLSDFADINPKRNLSKNTEARCIDMAKLSTSGAFPDGWDYKTYTGGMKFKNGDTILARITPCLENGKTAYINFLEVDEVAFGSTEYIVLAPKGAVPPELLYCLARYPRFVDYAVINMNGTSGRQRVSGEIIGQYQVPRFTEIELEEFASSVAVLFEKMKQNSIESMRLAEVRNILLPQLMSGELDVSDIKI